MLSLGGLLAIGQTMARRGFYAVRRGRQIGVVETWAECEQLVKGFAGARYKKFPTREEAVSFAAGEDNTTVDADARVLPNTTLLNEQLGKAPKRKFSPVAPHTGIVSDPRSNSDGTGEPEAKKIRSDSVVELPLSTSSDADRPVIYTDGACSGNGTSSARAGIGVYWGVGHVCNISEPLEGRPTNNRAEIHAAVAAIRQAKKQGFDRIEIRTDSSFLIKSITEWVPGWQRSGWKSATGKPVVNKEDFEVLLKAQEGIDIIWTHVRGHAGIHGNEMADRLAVAGMKTQKNL